MKRPNAGVPGFEAFVRESSTSLLQVAFLLVGDRGEAEDLLQVALVRTASHWPAAMAAPRQYARQVLVNLAKNHWRDRARRPPRADGSGEELRVPPADEGLGTCDEMARLLAQLPMEQRKVLVLRYYEDLSLAEIAAVLGCREGTVKSRCHRAVSALRIRLTDQSDIQEEPHVHR